MANRRQIIVVNPQGWKHALFYTDGEDYIQLDTLGNALRRVEASSRHDCRFYWNDVQLSLHLVKYEGVELRVKRDSRLLSEYIRQGNNT